MTALRCRLQNVLLLALAPLQVTSDLAARDVVQRWTDLVSVSKRSAHDGHLADVIEECNEA